VARAPSEKDIRAIEARLPGIACLQSGQWDRTYEYAWDWKKKLYDYTTIEIRLRQVVGHPPLPRHDGRPPVQAGQIFAIERPYDQGTVMPVLGPPGAYGVYNATTGQLDVKCSTPEQHWIHGQRSDGWVYLSDKAGKPAAGR
jgi:hypothetical protein